jgi:cell division protein FtsB
VLRISKHDWRSRLRQSTVLLFCLCSTAYFTNHALYGRHGLEARQKLTERSSLLDFEIRSLEAVRSKLARDVALLSPELPNSDLVEEIARDVLGFVAPGDKIVPISPSTLSPST